MSFLSGVCFLRRGFLIGRGVLATENLALQRQLAVLQRTAPRRKLPWRDRLFWVWLMWLWSGWSQPAADRQGGTIDQP